MSPVVSAKLCVLLFVFVSGVCSANTLLVVGDSLSAGYGVARNSGWVALLKQRLKEEQRNATVVNASISGDTTGGSRLRIKDLLRRHEPDIVIVELGANDGLRGGKISEMRENLSAIVELSQTSGAKVVLIGMRLPPNYGRDYVDRFHAVFKQVADQYGAALVPFMLAGFADDPSMFQEDGIHPTASAQNLILNNIYPLLEPLL